MGLLQSFFLAYLLGTAGSATIGVSDFGAPGATYQERWIYSTHNLVQAKQVEDLIKVMARGHRSGYTAIVLCDSKLGNLRDQPPVYFTNVDRVRKAAAELSMEIIPGVFAVGSSNNLLASDPNLAEGVPVEQAPFVVKEDEAVLVRDPALVVTNGGFEQVVGHRFQGFDLQDGIGRTSFADHDIWHGGRTSCRIQDVEQWGREGECRLAQKVNVRPHACYRFSCWARTQELRPASSFQLLVKSMEPERRTLTYVKQPVRSTQGWTRFDVIFNSLTATRVELFVGVWHCLGGKIWLDDLDLEELSLVNVLRRAGCPVRVTSDDGTKVYQEGADYRPIRDEKLGQIPNPGKYDFRHEGARLRLTSSSQIRAGQPLRVSWYHPLVVSSGNVTCCLSDPKVYTLLADEAARVNSLFKPRSFFMRHDEARVIGWCRQCQGKHEAPGALLAHNVKRCVEILHRVNPQARVAIWSDMFDPYANAVDHYYLVNGDLQGSWQGLPPEVIVCNWDAVQARKSLEWFSSRGHRQVVAGFYDGRHEFTPAKWHEAARGIKGVIGFMYTSWVGPDYRELENFGRQLRAWPE